MSPQSTQRWFSITPHSLAWREWDGEFVVRNERSGSTHLVGPLAGRVLQVLLQSRGGMSIQDIMDRLGEPPAPADQVEWHTAIDAVLSEFQRLGIAEAAPQ